MSSCFRFRFCTINCQTIFNYSGPVRLITCSPSAPPLDSHCSAGTPTEPGVRLLADSPGRTPLWSATVYPDSSGKQSHTLPVRVRPSTCHPFWRTPLAAPHYGVPQFTPSIGDCVGAHAPQARASSISYFLFLISCPAHPQFRLWL